MNYLLMHSLRVTRLNIIVKQITHVLGPIQTTNICGTICVTKYPVDFDGELRIGDIRYENMI